MADQQPKPAAPFCARWLRVCGFYPFEVSRDAWQFEFELGIFGGDNPFAREFLRLRRETFSPELAWQSNAEGRSFSIQSLQITLSTGRRLSNVAGDGFVLIYRQKFANLFLMLRFGDATFSMEEVGELHALMKGTQERAGPGAASVSLTISGQDHSQASLAGVLRLFADEFCRTYSVTRQMGAVEFVYPVIYVGEVPGTKSARDLASDYRAPIAGILDLWLKDSHFLKDQDVMDAWKSDIHPLEYGVTLIGSHSTIELHPEGDVAEIAKIEGVTVEGHHDREIAFLVVMSEYVVSQYFLLRTFSEMILRQIRNVRLGEAAILNPMRLLFYGYGLFQLRKSVIDAVSEFDRAFLSRKPYVRKAIDIMRGKLGVTEAQTSLLRNIDITAQTTKEVYTMLLALLALSVSCISLFVALLSKF